ncbi:hypothetical protein [Spongiivirga citrea]|uniref:Uncharacterized protein n=1 Tax=Spongiivirga citrea TaxID=1481457 RepID=A0A6M0CM98_9FLAO|nr:hypothetical protein [Spongiivirga citrea]NER18762.1 hypothetical protein [Spongiivirga citrea]
METDLQRWIKKVRKFLYKHLVWINIIISLVMFYLSTKAFISSDWQSILEKAGIAVLSTGVFAAVLKSLQFLGLFKEELEKIILSSDFVEHRTDLDNLWKKITSALYKQKFPDLNHHINNAILNTYLPINEDYYYKEVRVTLNIHELTEDFMLSFTQTTEIDVVVEKGVKECTFTHTFRRVKESDDNIINEKEYFYVDDEDLLEKIKKEPKEDENEVVTKYEYTVSDKKTFTLKTQEKRKYPILNDNYKIFRVEKFTKEFDVSISYPDNVRVSFFNVGVAEPFEKKHTIHSNTISRVHKKGVILPYQGFGITFAQRINS